MDLENQKRVKDLTEEYGPENVVVLLGGSGVFSGSLDASGRPCTSTGGSAVNGKFRGRNLHPPGSYMTFHGAPQLSQNLDSRKTVEMTEKK